MMIYKIVRKWSRLRRLLKEVYMKKWSVVEGVNRTATVRTGRWVETKEMEKVREFGFSRTKRLVLFL